jgi:plasmid stabilization system protein ParE
MSSVSVFSVRFFGKTEQHRCHIIVAAADLPEVSAARRSSSRLPSCTSAAVDHLAAGPPPATGRSNTSRRRSSRGRRNAGSRRPRLLSLARMYTSRRSSPRCPVAASRKSSSGNAGAAPPAPAVPLQLLSPALRTRLLGYCVLALRRGWRGSRRRGPRPRRRAVWSHRCRRRLGLGGLLPLVSLVELVAIKVCW